MPSDAPNSPSAVPDQREHRLATRPPRVHQRADAQRQQLRQREPKRDRTGRDREPRREAPAPESDAHAHRDERRDDENGREARQVTQEVEGEELAERDGIEQHPRRLEPAAPAERDGHQRPHRESDREDEEQDDVRPYGRTPRARLRLNSLRVRREEVRARADAERDQQRERQPRQQPQRRRHAPRDGLARPQRVAQQPPFQPHQRVEL